jgi:hypothetical protein
MESLKNSPKQELCSSLASFETWLQKQEAFVQAKMEELGRSQNLSFQSDLKGVPADTLLLLTDSALLSSQTVFAKCITQEGKSLHDSKFDYNQPIGTIVRASEFDNNGNKCGKGIHLVLPCHAIRLAIMYHYLGQHDLQICFVTVPQVDPLNSSINRIVKSNAFNQVSKLRVAFVKVEGFLMIEAFSMLQTPALEITESKLFRFESLSIPKSKQTSLSLTDMDCEKDVKRRWETLQTLYTRMVMTLNCPNLNSVHYAYFFVVLKNHLAGILEDQPVEKKMVTKPKRLEEKYEMSSEPLKPDENSTETQNLLGLPWSTFLIRVQEKQLPEIDVLKLLLKRSTLSKE